MGIETALVLFNRDLRVHDHPALAAAAEAERTVPLFVLDERLLGSRFAAPNRVAFMLEALYDLDGALRREGGRLFIRRGDPVREAIAVARQCGANSIHVSADWSAYAREREARLTRACEEERIEFTAHPGVTVVPPGAVTPTGGDHFKVFTPFHRAWSRLPQRPRLAAPMKLKTPANLRAGRLPALSSLTSRRSSPGRMRGGEDVGRRLMRAFLRDGGAFVRQLCWRDFHHQVLAATPSLPHRDYRPRRDRWSRSERALAAWREGADRLSAGRRGDAPARPGGLHAQPGADDRRLVPLQGPLRRLAAGRLALLGPAQRR